MSPSEAGSHSRTAIVLHWLIAALVIAELAWGWWMQGIPKQPPGPRADAFNLHKSIGLVVLLLMVRGSAGACGTRRHRCRRCPSGNARLAHREPHLIYVAVFVMPIAGYLGSALSGFPVKFFGVTLPAWGWKEPALKEFMSAVHFATSWVLLARSRCTSPAPSSTGSSSATRGGAHGPSALAFPHFAGASRARQPSP